MLQFIGDWRLGLHGGRVAASGGSDRNQLELARAGPAELVRVGQGAAEPTGANQSRPELV